MRQAIVAEFRIWADGARTVCAIHAILVLVLVLTLVIPTGCSPTAVTDDDQAPEGVTEKMNSDAADCRKQTRTMAGANPSAWYDRAYSDCMAGRGYKSDAGRTK
jgi:hypothetical protein